jgi:hypothetical protein
VAARPVDAESAAIHEDEHDGLAERDHLLKEILLHARQFERCAVASGEALNLHGHLLAFQARREAEDHHDRIGGAGGVERLLLETGGLGEAQTR